MPEIKYIEKIKLPNKTTPSQLDELTVKDSNAVHGFNGKTATAIEGLTTVADTIISNAEIDELFD